MDIFLFEQLAQTVHHSSELPELINKLPNDIKFAFLENDIHKLRHIISGKTIFSDAQTVSWL